MMPSISAEIRSAEAEGDTAKAKELMTELDGMRHLATQAMAPQNPQNGGGSIDPRVQASITQLKGKSPADIETALSDPRIPADSKAAIRKGLGLSEISGPAPEKPFAQRQSETRQKIGDILKNTLGNPVLNPLAQ